MEQTSTFESLISNISKMTIFDQFVQTIFVEDSNGFIEVEKIQKVENSLKLITTDIAYTLKSHRVISKKMHSSNITISDLTEGQTIAVDKSICRCVSSDLNKLFIRELSSFVEVDAHTFNLFSQPFLKRLLNKNTNTKFINQFIEIGKGMGWAIIPYNLIHIFYSSPLMRITKEDDQRMIYNLGTMGGLSIYVNPDDTSGKIYYGNFDSIIILAKKDIDITQDQHGTIYNFQYLFIENGIIKSLQVI